MRSKYKCGDDLLPKIERLRLGSHFWSEIKQTWDLLEFGLDHVTTSYGVNEVRWRFEKNGIFSIRLAYSLIREDDIEEESKWKKLWKL